MTALSPSPSLRDRASLWYRKQTPASWLSLAQRIAFEAAFAFFTLRLVRPAFASLHLPMQDLPQHMAAVSVLKRYPFDSTLRQYFELTLSRTQYLSVYALGVLLAIPFGVEYGMRLIVALTVISIPYALRFALRRTGGDERFACLVWPFLWNPQMMFGFLNFLLGIPLALIAIGLFARSEGRTSRRRQVALALLSLATFYSHLIPFGLLGLGVLFVRRWGAAFDGLRAAFAPPEGRVEPDVGTERAPSKRDRVKGQLRALPRALLLDARTALREYLFLVPSLLAVVVWVIRSPARDVNVRAGGLAEKIEFQWPDKIALPGQFRGEILNVAGDLDEYAMIAWGLCLMIALALSRSRAPSLDRDANPARSRAGWLPFVCAALYIGSPASYGWIWPIHTRFAVAAVLVLPLAFARSRARVLPWLMILALGTTSVRMIDAVAESFHQWDEREMGDLDQALANARPGKRLVALVPATQSAYIPSNVPLLHVAAYYQIRGGAVSTFTFADFPQSPFRYRDDGPRPRKLIPRWEWQTTLRGSIGADPQHDYYDYVLTRVGYSDEPAFLPEEYTRIYAGAEWNLYERKR